MSLSSQVIEELEREFLPLRQKIHDIREYL